MVGVGGVTRRFIAEHSQRQTRACTRATRVLATHTPRARARTTTHTPRSLFVVASGLVTPLHSLFFYFLFSSILLLFAQGKYGVPLYPDYVSIDIDTADLWVFKALAATYRPRVRLGPHASFLTF